MNNMETNNVLSRSYGIGGGANNPINITMDNKFTGTKEQMLSQVDDITEAVKSKLIQGIENQY